jgi:hypothetical protein
MVKRQRNIDEKSKVVRVDFDKVVGQSSKKDVKKLPVTVLSGFLGGVVGVSAPPPRGAKRSARYRTLCIVVVDVVVVVVNTKNSAETGTIYYLKLKINTFSCGRMFKFDIESNYIYLFI